MVNIVLSGMVTGSGTSGDCSGASFMRSRIQTDTADWYPESNSEAADRDILSLITMCKLGMEGLLDRLRGVLESPDMGEGYVLGRNSCLRGDRVVQRCDRRGSLRVMQE